MYLASYGPQSHQLHHLQSSSLFSLTFATCALAAAAVCASMVEVYFVMSHVTINYCNVWSKQLPSHRVTII